MTKVRTPNFLEILATFIVSWAVYVVWYFVIINSPDFPVNADWLFIAVWWICNFLFISLCLGGYFFIIFKTKNFISRSEYIKQANVLSLISATSIFGPLAAIYLYDQVIRIVNGQVFILKGLSNLLALNLMLFMSLFVLQMFLAWLGSRIALWMSFKTKPDLIKT
ncbi:MAG: hypothetical protein OHK0017_04720 [Patescibacteria group bacterium]